MQNSHPLNRLKTRINLLCNQTVLVLAEVKFAIGKVYILATEEMLIWPELISVFVATGNISTPPWMGCLSIAGLPPALSSLLPIYTPE